MTTTCNVINEGRETKALRSATLSGGTVPNRVLLAPWGTVESSNGSFVLDDESAKLAKIAGSGKFKAAAAQFSTLGKNACATCHKKFREKKK